MGRVLLIARLAARDLRRRPAEAVLLLLAIMAATTTLTLGLVLRDAASDPYRHTRAATGGPDVVASVFQPAGLAGLGDLSDAAGVTDHSGPYPVVAAKLRIAGRSSDVQAVGRDAVPASVDQPALVQGTWVAPGGVVLEAAFATVMHARIGDPVTVNDRSFTVVGIAVTAAMSPYPESTCMVPVGCVTGPAPDGSGGFEPPPDVLRNPGLVWLSQADARGLASGPEALAYVMHLKLANPDAARGFVDTHASQQRNAPVLVPWQEIRDEATALARDAQIVLLIGAWLLGLLAVASISVLVGGRMADQSRRVGLLKAVGGTPGLVAAVLLAEYILVAVVAAGIGLALGTLTAPLLTESGAGLIGSAGTPALTLSTIGLVMAAAVGVAGVATAVPAVRAARSSTVNALADAARPPRRTGWIVGVSARLPVTLLLAARVAARRPRRVALGVVSVAITVSGVYVALILNAFLTSGSLAAEYEQAQVALLRQVLTVVMAVLLCLAAVNAVFVAWATVLDNRHSSALARALGATSREMTAALATAQVVPALVGALLGIFPGGYLLFMFINAITGGERDRATYPSPWQVLMVVLAAGLVVAALTAVPARIGGRRPVTEALRAGLT